MEGGSSNVKSVSLRRPQSAIDRSVPDTTQSCRKPVSPSFSPACEKRYVGNIVNIVPKVVVGVKKGFDHGGAMDGGMREGRLVE
eukprot:scaffold12500_cov154-Amphora_coffeaeformis.AAC.2